MSTTEIFPERCERRVLWALALSVGLLLTSQLGYGLLDHRYSQAFESVPIPRGSLERLPLNLDGWIGRNEAIGEALIRATDTDDHVSRTYRSANGRGAVGLWIGYGGRFRDLLPHRPEICYPAHGYILAGQEQVQLTAVGGLTLPCRILRFARGDVQSEFIAVLSYYLVDGQYSPDVSLLRAKAMRLEPAGRYMAQIQIICRYDPSSDLPDAPVRRFAEVSAAPIRQAVQAAIDEGGSVMGGGGAP